MYRFPYFCKYAAGIWSMMSSSSSTPQPASPLADEAVLLLLVLTHQEMSGHNPYRRALFQFTDEHSGSSRKTRASFSLNLQKLYLSLCKSVTVFFKMNLSAFYN